VSELDTPYSLFRAYEDGMKGYIFDMRAKMEFLESQKYQYFDEPNIKGSGKGKRALLWQYATKLDKRCFTEKQTTGDCVSHGSRNARDMTRATEILVKKEPEDWFSMGATEPTYGARGHGGEGMAPARASQFERDVGFLVRTNYEGVVDLSKYNSSIGSRWGSSGVPGNVKELCRKNKVGVITNVRTQDDLMDAMFNGYAAHSGQYASWAASPNSKNIHTRTPGGWNHDMAIAGYDSTLEYWPFTVWFIQNSWGPWNQPIKDWPKDYPPCPPGMIVTSAEDFNVCVDNGDCWTYGSVDGFPPQRLPDFGTIGMLHHGE
jgi:hypothetical protein